LKESGSLLRKAEQIDPLSALLATNAAMNLLRQGADRAALAEAQKAMELDPTQKPAWRVTAFAYERLGNREKAAEMYERGADVPGLPGSRESMLIHLNMLRGNQSEAEKLVRSLEQRAALGEVPQTIVGCGYSTIGDRDKAFLWLNRGLAAREPALRDNRLMYESVSGDPRFDELMRRLARGFDD